MPVIWVAVTAIACLLADIFLAGRSKVTLAYIALTGLALAFYFMTQYWTDGTERIVLGGSLAVSKFGYSVGIGLLVAAGLTSLSAAQYGRGSAVATGEFYGLVLFATAGGMVLTLANDLVTLFVSLETMSLSVYALTGIARGRSTSAEGAMKYFVLGAMASGFLLYGSALLYGATGTMQLFPLEGDIEALRYGLAQPSITMKGPLAVTGVGCILVAILFKIGAVPFHGWVSDAYEGAPAPSTGFMSVAVKAAAFAAFLKIVLAVGLGAAVSNGEGDWGGVGLSTVLWWVAVLSLIVGNFGALMQSNPKRMLAYSGIAHTGYALIALVVVALELEKGSGVDGVLIQSACSAFLFYLLAYAVTNLSAFAMLCSLERGGRDIQRIDQLSGLAEASPLSAFAMLAAMISLAGIPLTGGFTGKVWLFQSALKEELIGLVLLGLTTSIVSLYYYLRVVVAMYMQPAVDEDTFEEVELPSRWTARCSMILGVVGIFALGLMPSSVMTIMQDGARALFAG
jgi:NADH-quinone oxidoreductase subunit N